MWSSMVVGFAPEARNQLVLWLRGVDLNHRPLGYEPNELPDCSTPQSHGSVAARAGQIFSPIFPLSAFESHVGRS